MVIGDDSSSCDGYHFTKHVQTCLYMSVNLPIHDSSAFSIYSPLSSASITHSLQPTYQLHPLSRFPTIPLSLLHTTIRQISYIFQAVDMSFSRHIQTCSNVFRHVQTCLYYSYIITMKIPWLLAMTHHHMMVIMVAKHVQTCLYMSALSSTCITPSLQPTCQSHPLSHFGQYHFHFYIQPSIKLLTFSKQWMCCCRVIFWHVQTCLYDSYIITMKIPWLLGWHIIMWWLSWLPNMFKHVCICR